MNSSLIEQVRAAGVVGAGGAGFPTHVKLKAEVDTVLVNGASCEPLLGSDPYLMEHESAAVIRGTAAVMETVGAKRGYICIKAKHAAAVRALQEELAGLGDSALSLQILDDFYPAGDEHVLVDTVLDRRVPAGGIPLEAGVVVVNTETVFNIDRAVTGEPVIYRYLTLAGELENPGVVRAPVGTPVRELLEFSGWSRSAGSILIDGGPMMGMIIDPETAVVGKTTSGLLLFPKDHPVVNTKAADMERIVKIARTICCQCTHCTELCPRYLLGHQLRPHKLMQSLNAFTDADRLLILQKEALLCSECGICEKFACPMGISPREVNGEIKKSLAGHGIRIDKEQASRQLGEARDLRRVPTGRLMDRLDIRRYYGKAPYLGSFPDPAQVSIPLSRHIGAPSLPLVEPGERVTRGTRIAAIPEGALGAEVHASIPGRIEAVEDTYIRIRKES